MTWVETRIVKVGLRLAWLALMLGIRLCRSSKHSAGAIERNEKTGESDIVELRCVDGLSRRCCRPKQENRVGCTLFLGPLGAGLVAFDGKNSETAGALMICALLPGVSLILPKVRVRVDLLTAELSACACLNCLPSLGRSLSFVHRLLAASLT